MLLSQLPALDLMAPLWFLLPKAINLRSVVAASGSLADPAKSEFAVQRIATERNLLQQKLCGQNPYSMILAATAVPFDPPACHAT